MKLKKINKSNIVKKKFFSTPTILSFDYKSTYFNWIVKTKYSLNIHAFWKSLTWFSHSLTTTQPVQLSTLKFSFNWAEFLNLYKLLLISNNWITFTFTDISSFFNFDKKKIKENFKKIFLEQPELELFILDKWFFSSFINFNNLFLINTDCSNVIGTTILKEINFLKKKLIYANPIPSDLKFIFYKFFSFFRENDELLNYFSICEKKWR